MAKIKGSDLTLIIAELIKRMSPDEQAELASHVSLEMLKRLEKMKIAKEKIVLRDKEPEAYVKVHSDYISFEVSEDKIIKEFVLWLANFFHEEPIEMRLSKDSQSKELRSTLLDFEHKISKYENFLVEGVSTFEFGSHTLYSMGKGCMLLETPIELLRKKEIALKFLDMCGYQVRVKESKFSAFVKNGKLRG